MTQTGSSGPGPAKPSRFSGRMGITHRQCPAASTSGRVARYRGEAIEAGLITFRFDVAPDARWQHDPTEDQG